MESSWTRVASSILEAVAYDSRRLRLLIRFRTGAVFEYEGVPAVVWEELLAAPSKGGYFSEYVRPEYPYRQLRGADRIVEAAAR